MIKVYSYEEMERSGLPLDILEEMRRFGYARYDVFDGFDCVSLEMLDYDDLLLSRGSVLLYLEKEKITCFTSQKEEIECLFSGLSEKYTQDRILFSFFEGLTAGDDMAFDAMEQEVTARCMAMDQNFIWRVCNG